VTALVAVLLAVVIIGLVVVAVVLVRTQRAMRHQSAWPRHTVASSETTDSQHDDVRAARGHGAERR